MYDKKRFDAFANELRKYHDFNIKYKNESLLMKILSFILFFVPSFKTKYITTIGNNIYFPSREFTDNHVDISIATLAHEFVHVIDNKKLGSFKYVYMYLFPQILALVSILSIFVFLNNMFLFWLVFLIFLLPIPSFSRKNLELKAYKISIYMMYLELKEFGKTDDEIKNILKGHIDFINKQFTGPGYYFMWPFGVKDELNSFAESVFKDTNINTLHLKIQESWYSSRSR